MTLIFIALALLSFYNDELGKSISESYSGISPKWGLIPLGLAIGWSLIKANFDEYSKTQSEIAEQKKIIEKLQTPQLEIEYSGKPPHRDTVLNQDIFRLAVRNKSQTGDAELVNLWLTDVSSVSGWQHNIGEAHLQQYGDVYSEERGYRIDAVLTPGQARDYSFISRWREHEAPIILWLAALGSHTLPHGQYTITVKATASGSIACYRKFLVGMDNQNRLTTLPLGPTFVKD